MTREEKIGTIVAGARITAARISPGSIDRVAHALLGDGDVLDAVKRMQGFSANEIVTFMALAAIGVGIVRIVQDEALVAAPGNNRNDN